METLPSRPTQPPGYPWKIFWVLLFASVIGVAAILPYVFDVFGKIISAHPLPMPLPVLIVVQFMENTLFFGGIIALGLLLAGKVGIKCPSCGAGSTRNERSCLRARCGSRFVRRRDRRPDCARVLLLFRAADS